MIRFLSALIAALAVALPARADSPVVTNIANFPSLSVAYTNYVGSESSRLAISHTGTNGAVVFDSQSSGTVGLAGRPFLFSGAGVNFSNSQQIGYPTFAQSPLGTFTNIIATNLASGLSDLYTVPAGYKFFAWSTLMTTTNGTSTSVDFRVKTNAVYYRLAGATITLTTNSSTSASGITLLDAGETLAVNTTLIGVNLLSSGILFKAESPLASYRFVNFAVGNNTIFTVASGKTYYPYNSGSPLNTSLTYVNSSGAPVTIKFYIVPPGGVTGIATLYRTAAVSDSASSALVVPPLIAGTSVIINSDSSSAGQMVWAPGAEY